jgi:hypothetical protein
MIIHDHASRQPRLLNVLLSENITAEKVRDLFRAVSRMNA